jgi:outer membrane protein OmpA-like peptidoglycan-associated protein
MGIIGGDKKMNIKGSYAVVALILGTIWGTGCATKGYVRNQVQPVNAKVDTVQQQANKQGADIQQTSQRVQQNEQDISATKEVANSAESKAGDALTQGKQNSQQLGELRNVVANLDDYKVADQTAVHFGFNKDTLTPDAKEDLDKLAAQVASGQRYFITIEGFTDQIGPATYNEELSRRRANHVIEYLVGQKDVPLQRIFVIGLGKTKLIDNGRTRKARAESRRAEITLYTAPPLSAATQQGSQSQ